MTYFPLSDNGKPSCEAYFVSSERLWRLPVSEGEVERVAPQCADIRE